jgi:hypothetical protein
MITALCLYAAMLLAFVLLIDAHPKKSDAERAADDEAQMEFLSRWRGQ